MAECLIKRNSDGSIDRVFNPIAFSRHNLAMAQSGGYFQNRRATEQVSEYLSSVLGYNINILNSEDMAAELQRRGYGSLLGGERQLIDFKMEETFVEAENIPLQRNSNGELLAPNGKVSNLNELQWRIVRTPAFKSWFGDWLNNPANSSKVVDENGEPLVVYHGTSEVFTEFDKSKSYDTAFWFTSDIGKIERAEAGAGSVGLIYPTFLNIRKVAGWSEYESSSLGEIQRDDFDGVVLDDDYIALEPNQIKLADGTNRIFSSQSNDIRYLSSSGVVYGFADTQTGEIYLSDEYLNSGTLIHELYHLFKPALKNLAGGGNVQAKNLLDTMRELSDRLGFNEQQYIDTYNRSKEGQAQEYFTREADRLPLTLAVFNTKPFQDLQGKQVNPVTIQQLLNKTGIKQIEKDLINQVLSDNYSGQKRINYDEFEATVRANIMPLERLTTSSYADYGMDNLGDGNYGEAKTLILNSPIEHGVTGHFSGDFKASSRKNIKYVPKQLNDNTWVAVEEGYETQANNNNIYQFVGTAGTKESVESWIENYNSSKTEQKFDKDFLESKGVMFSKYNKQSFIDKYGEEEWNLTEYSDNDIIFEAIVPEAIEEQFDIPNVRQRNTSFESVAQILGYTETNEYKAIPDINKGMFGHIRVWQDGQDFYVAELQSDYFQKNNARKSILESRKDYKEIINEYEKQVDIVQQELVKEERSTLESIDKGLRDGTVTYQDRERLMSEINQKFKRRKDTLYKDSVQKRIEKEILPKLSPQEKQFIASQKIWEQRMVREAIKEASLSGATSLRFPTPYTLSVIEGYISANLTDQSTLPYENYGKQFLEINDVVGYGYGDRWVVTESGQDNITVTKLRELNGISTNDVKRQFGDNYEEGKVLKSENISFYIIPNDSRVFSLENVTQSFGQPSAYKTINQKEDFSIENDLSETQQTVARKYEEIAEILKKERGDNFEVVTDKNGFDWYETKITPEESQNPVVAFQIAGEQGARNLDQVTEQLQKTGLAKKVHTLSPQQIEQELIRRGVDSNVAKQVSAWHGSPHLFNRFTLSTIGTGEGAQAFGWGLYFADLEGIARGYADSLTKKQFLSDGKEILNDDVNFYLRGGLNIKNEVTDKTVQYALEEARSDYRENPYANIKEAIELLEGMLNSEIKIKPNRNLYKVTLHKGKTPSEYTWLEWDKDVSQEQAEKIKKALFDYELPKGYSFRTNNTKSKYAVIYELIDSQGNVVGEGLDKDEALKNAKLGSRFYKYSSAETRSKEFDKIFKRNSDGKYTTGGGFYNRLSDILGGDKQASLFLLENGIDGVKYPAESISRGATSDTARGFNYVVFDENAITIEEQIQFQNAGLGLLPNGFVDLNTKEVFLNKETANLDTPIHEFSHLFTNILKQTNPQLYQRGLELIEKEGKEYINFVKKNQPNLKGEALLDEALNQAVGESGAKIINKQSSLFQWIQDMWDSLKDMLGLTQYSWNEVKDMNLQQFTEAMAVDLLRGEELKFKNEAQAIKEISKDKLLAVHNLSISNLLNVDKQGGLAVPSLAVINTDNPFTSFGEITLVADKSLIDPKESRLNKAFASDSYSVRYPSIIYTPNHKKLREFNERVKKELPYLDERDSFRNVDDRGRADVENDNVTKLLFLKEQGKEKDFVFRESEISDKYLDRFEKLLEKTKDSLDFTREDGKVYQEFSEILKDEQLDTHREDIKNGELTEESLLRYSQPNSNSFYSYRQSLNARKNKELNVYKTLDKNQVDVNSEEYQNFVDEIYDNLEVTEQIFNGYTPSGNRRYVPHTIENVVRMMKGGARKGEGFFYGVGSVRAGIVKQFKSIKDIKDSQDKIVSSEEFEKVKEEINNEFLELGEKLKPFYKYQTDSFGYFDNVGESLIEFYNRGRSQDFNQLDKETEQEVKDFLEKLYNLPTEYFEVKIERAVDLSEFKGALIPKNTPQKVRNILESKGLKVVEYSEKIDYNEFADLRFQTQTEEELSQGELRARTSSIAYQPRPSESLTDYVERMREEFEANLLGENSIEYFNRIAEENKLSEEEKGTLFEQLKQWIKDFSSWIANQLGWGNLTPQQAENLSVREVFDRITTSMLRGDFGVASDFSKLIGENRIEVSELTNEQINEYTEKVTKGLAALERLPQEVERGRIRGGKHLLAATLLGSRSYGTSYEVEETEAAVSELEQYAKDNGVWVENYREEYPNFLDRGEEAEVFFNEGKGTVTKVMSPYTMHTNFLELADRIALHNRLYPKVAYEVVGFTRNEQGVAFILEQPYIKIAEQSNGQLVMEEMANLGFTPVDVIELEDGTVKASLYSNGEILIEDMHSNNVVIGEQGEIQFIDAVIRPNVPEQGYGGAVELRNTIVETPQGQEQFQIIGERGAAELDMQRNSVDVLQNLTTAKQLEFTLGVSEADWISQDSMLEQRKHIKMATGWERGADLKWYYEVSDSKFINVRKMLSAMNDGGTHTFLAGDILRGGEIFNAYPELKEYTIKIINDENTQNTEAYFGGERSKTITINSYKFREHFRGRSEAEILGESNDLRGLRRVVSHELAHIVLGRLDMTSEERGQSLFSEMEAAPRANQISIVPSELTGGFIAATEDVSDNQRALLRRSFADTVNYSPQISNVAPPTVNSIAYQSISRNPHIPNEEAATNVFYNLFSEKFKKFFGEWEGGQQQGSPFVYENGEPKLFYKTPSGEVTESFAEALALTPEGKIEAGFIQTEDVLVADSIANFAGAQNDVISFGSQMRVNNKSVFLSVMEVSAESNPKTLGGFINSQIREGYLSGEKVLGLDGNYHLAGRGATQVARVYNAAISRSKAARIFGTSAVTLKGREGLLDITPVNQDTFTDEHGREKSKSAMVDLLKQGKVAEVRKVVGNLGSFLGHVHIQNSKTLFGREEAPATPREEQLLKNQMISLLQDLGISITTISDYVDSYSVRNGVDLTVEAIADVSNQVVAFAEGKMTAENLTEEAAHFIIEAYKNQDEINAILPEVVNTQEYAEYAEIYREKYSQLYKNAEEVENAVRREILGKILAGRIQGRFSQESVSEGFWSTLQRVFDTFISNVRSFFTRQHSQRMEAFLDRVSDLAARREISNDLSIENFKNNDTVLYATGTGATTAQNQSVRLSAQIEKLRQAIQSRVSFLGKTKDPSVNSMKAEMNKLVQAKEQLDVVASAKIALSIHEKELMKLERRIKSHLTGSGAFTLQDHASYRYLTEIALPIINEFGSVVNQSSPETATALRGLSQRINALQGMSSQFNGNEIAALIDRYVSDYGLTQEEADSLRQSFVGVQKEVGWFQRNFGQLEHAKNPFLNLLGRMINNTHWNAQRDALQTVQGFLEKAKSWSMDRWRGLFHNKDGKNTGYLLSDVDFVEYYKNQEVFLSDFYERVLTPQQKADLQANNQKPNRSVLTEAQYNQLMTEELQWKLDNREMPMLAQYYIEQEQEFVAAGIGADNRAFLSELSMRTYDIKKKYITAGGRIDYSKMDKEDKDELAQITLERKARKSLYDSTTGERKTGDDLRVAEELIALDEIRFAKAKSRGTSDEFLTELANVEASGGTSAAMDFLLSNGGITYTDRFWREIGLSPNMEAKLDMSIVELDAEGETAAADRLRDLKDDYMSLSEKRKEILKQHGKLENPAEINTEVMTATARQNILEAEEQMQDILEAINQLLIAKGESVITVQAENTTNLSYSNDLADSGKAERDFIKEHLTKTNKRKVDNFESTLTAIQNGRVASLRPTSSLARWFKNNKGVENMSDIQAIINAEGVDVLTVEYAKPKLAGYYKRFAPAGYEALLADLQGGTKSVSQVATAISEYQKIMQAWIAANLTPQEAADFTESTLRYLDPAKVNSYNEAKQRAIASTGMAWQDVMEHLKISTRFEWADVNPVNGQTLINPNYEQDSAKGVVQPRRDKYRNEDYYRKFNPDASGRATTNTEDWQMLQDILGLHRKAYQDYGQEGANLYLAPQIRKSGAERVSGLSVSNVVGSLKEMIYNRVDDQDYGAQEDGVDIGKEMGINLVPKYYINPLEDPTEVSEDLAQSVTALVREAALYKQRVKNVDEVLLLQSEMLNLQFSGGKSAGNTNAHQMFKNFVDMYFYGIKQTSKLEVSVLGRRIDLSKLMSKFENYIRRLNIGYSLPIAASSAAMSQINKHIERALGENLQHGSVTWSAGELNKLLGSYASNYGNIDRTDKLYVMREAFGLGSLRDRTENASFNKLIKGVWDSPFGFMEILSTPHSTQIMLAVLDDFRLIGDRVITFNEFKKSVDNQGKPLAAIKEEWSRQRENSMYNLVEFRDGNMRFTEAIENQIGKEYANRMLERAANKVRSTNSNIDALVSETDRSAATRHFLMNYLMTHKGWFTIAIQRRFKDQHFNFNTGEYEVGHYRSLVKLINNSFKNINNPAELISKVQAEWGNLSEQDKRNLKRVLIEQGVFLGLSLLVMGLVLADDDEDNKENWALHLGTYLMLRTTSEFGSTQLPSGLFETLNIVKNPFVAANSLSSIKEGFSFETVKSGAYKGYSKFGQMAIKQTWFRHYKDLENVKSKSDAYRYFNSSTLFLAQKKKKGELDGQEVIDPYSQMSLYEALNSGIRRN